MGEQAGNVRKRKGKFDRFEQFNECDTKVDAQDYLRHTYNHQVKAHSDAPFQGRQS